MYELKCDEMVLVVSMIGAKQETEWAAEATAKVLPDPVVATGVGRSRGEAFAVLREAWCSQRQGVPFPRLDWEAIGKRSLWFARSDGLRLGSRRLELRGLDLVALEPAAHLVAVHAEIFRRQDDIAFRLVKRCRHLVVREHGGRRLRRHRTGIGMPAVGARSSDCKRLAPLARAAAVARRTSARSSRTLPGQKRVAHASMKPTEAPSWASRRHSSSTCCTCQEFRCARGAAASESAPARCGSRGPRGKRPAPTSARRSRKVAAQTRTLTRSEVVAPRRMDFARLEHTQELALDIRPAAPRLRRGRACRRSAAWTWPSASVGAGERAASRPEEEPLGELLGNRGAIQGDERALRLGRRFVEGPRRDLLARPGLADDEHRRHQGFAARERDRARARP